MIGCWYKNLDNQRIIFMKFFSRFGSDVMISDYDKATYSLIELDGTKLKVSIIGKRLKIFKCLE